MQQNNNKLKMGILLMIGICLLSTGIYIYLTTNHKRKEKATSDIVKENTLESSTQEYVTALEGKKIPNGKAPNFALTNPQLTKTSLQDLAQNQRKLVIFTDVDCDYCKAYYPVLHKFKTKYPQIDIVIIRLHATPKDNGLFLDETGYDFTVLVGNKQVFDDYDVAMTPTTFVLAKDNTILTSALVADDEGLWALVGKYVEENTAQTK
ncbi:MAG TPA: hypothetical protein DCS93_24465 [Microscillaceae bacterium]|nr:hypothetical protein [Microscillaceae bacterium]